MTVPLSIVISGGSIIDLDATLFVQVTVFFLVFLVLRRLLFRPVLRLLDARHEATEGTRIKAAELSAQAKTLLDEYGRQILDIRSAAHGERERMIEQARLREREILAATREEARSFAQKARRDAGVRADEVRAQLLAESGALAELVAAKVLGRAPKIQ